MARFAWASKDSDMPPRSLATLSALLPAIALVATIAVAIYMARPWGDNYAYQEIAGYIALLLFILWACSPYCYFLANTRNYPDSAPLAVSNLIAALLVCIGGLYLLADAAFIHIDAQGGLIFIFLPIYQWLVIGLFHGIGRLWLKVYGS